MKKAVIEQMDNGYLLTLESETLERPQRWVENSPKKICVHLAVFFTDGKEVFRVRTD